MRIFYSFKCPFFPFDANIVETFESYIISHWSFLSPALFIGPKIRHETRKSRVVMTAKTQRTLSSGVIRFAGVLLPLPRVPVQGVRDALDPIMASSARHHIREREPRRCDCHVVAWVEFNSGSGVG